MSLSATLFGTDSLIFKATNILGLGIPGLLHKTFGPGEPEAQRLGEISRQTAKEGDPRVIVWGRVRPIGGNIIHCQEPKKRMVKQSSSGGGKGGSKKKTQKVEHVFRTYAIGVCEGPITGFSRIWRNNKLVYDGRGTDWGARNNGVFLRSFRLYLGGWSQMPDPTLQSIWGAGNVPAYRGTAYMVSIDEDLTDQGGMVPQWQFEVERAEYVASTSTPYGLIQRDSAYNNPSSPDNALNRTVAHRKDSSESIAVGLSQPADVNTRSSIQQIPDARESITWWFTSIDNLVIETREAHRVNETEELTNSRPSLLGIAINTVVIRHAHDERLSNAKPRPSNMSIFT